MSNLSKSFVRGFGATLGVFAAKGFLDALRNPNYRTGGVSTRRQWYAIGSWIGITALLGFTLGGAFASLFFILGLIPIFIFQVWSQRKEERKTNLQERNLLLSKIKEITERTKGEGISFDLDINENTQNYHLENMLSEMSNKLDVLTRFRKKYEGDLLDRMIEGTVWLGMTKENLIDLKGVPSQTEKNENSRTVTEILIYGYSKRTGDVFTFKNDILVEFKDR